MTLEMQPIPEMVAVTLARLDERMQSMHSALNRIERVMENQRKEDTARIERLEKRVSHLESWRYKTVGALAIVMPLVSILGALLVKWWG